MPKQLSQLEAKSLPIGEMARLNGILQTLNDGLTISSEVLSMMTGEGHAEGAIEQSSPDCLQYKLERCESNTFELVQNLRRIVRVLDPNYDKPKSTNGQKGIR